MAPAGDLFQDLDAFLAANHMQFQELFQRYDANRDGYLDARELAALLSAVLPGLTPGQARYLQLMLDLEGRGQVSLHDFQAVARQCFEAGKSVRPHDKLQIEDVLRRLSEAMKRSQVGRRTFCLLLMLMCLHRRCSSRQLPAEACIIHSVSKTACFHE